MPTSYRNLDNVGDQLGNASTGQRGWQEIFVSPAVNAQPMLWAGCQLGSVKAQHFGICHRSISVLLWARPIKCSICSLTSGFSMCSWLHVFNPSTALWPKMRPYGKRHAVKYVPFEFPCILLSTLRSYWSSLGASVLFFWSSLKASVAQFLEKMAFWSKRRRTLVHGAIWCI